MNRLAMLLVWAVALIGTLLGPGCSTPLYAQGAGERDGMDIKFDVEGLEEIRPGETPPLPPAVQAIIIAFVLLGLALSVMLLIAHWIVFTKAGKPGWASLIPIYNVIVLLEICGRPLWWFLLLLIPCVNVVVSLVVLLDLAKSYGKDVGFAIGLWLLPVIFVPILAFGSARYVGPAAAG